MSKKDKFKLDGSDLDNNLDSFLDNLDDDDGWDLDIEADERKPLTIENFKKATAKEFKKPPKLSEIGKALEDTLPQELSPEYDILKSTYDTASKEFSKNFEALKKDMVPITGAIEKLSEKFLGQDNKLKKILQHLKPEEKYKGFNKQSLDDEVKNILQATLGGQEELQNKINSINQALEEKRAKTTNDILSGIRNDTALTRLMATDFTAPFQRKSLELQYRSNFYLKEILESAKASHQEQLELLKGIAKNTGLPDVVKQRTMEMLGADLKKQFRTEVMDRFIKNNPLLTTVKSNLSKMMTGAFNNARDGVSDLAMAIELSGGSSDIDYNQLLAMQARESAMNGIFRVVNPMLMKNKGIRKGLNRFKMFFDDPQSLFSEAKSKIKGYGYKENALRSILGVGERLVRNPNEPTKLDTNRLDLEMAATLDVRTKLAINKVIPGYLRKIHSEIRASRLKIEDYDVKNLELSYSHAQEKFVESGSLSSILKSNIAERMRNETSSGIDRLAWKLKRTKSGVSDEKIEEISKYLAMATTSTSSTGVSFLNDKKVGEIIPEHLKNDYNKLLNTVNKKADEDTDFIDEMRSSVSRVRSSIPNVNRFFQELMKNGDIDVLVELGIVSYDSLRDRFIPNEANILNIMFETYGITDPMALKNATGETKESASRLGRMIKRDILKGKKKVSEVVKNIASSATDKEKIKKDVKSLAEDIVNKIETMGERTAKAYSSTIAKGKEEFNATNDMIRKSNIHSSDTVSRFRDKYNFKTKEMMEYHRELKDVLTSKFGDLGPMLGKHDYFKKSEEEQEIETFDNLVKSKEREFKALKLIETAIETNSTEAFKQVKETITSRGLDKTPSVAKKLRELDRFVEMKEKMGKEAMKNIDPENDPEGANLSLMGMLKSGLNMIPFGKTMKMIGKSTWWLMKRGWKNEAWLAKNLYFPALKGLAKSPLLLGKGLWGATKFGGRALGGLGKFAFGTGRKAARASGSLFLNSMSRLLTGRNMVGDTLFGGRREGPDSDGKETLKDKLINGFSKEEYEKRKGRKKKKPGLFKQFFNMLMKIGSGLLGAVGGLAGKVGLLATKALPALASGIAGIGGKIAGLFKGSPDLDINTDGKDGNNLNKKDPNKKPPKGGKNGLIDRVVNSIKGIKDKILKPIAKKVGPKAALRVVGKIAAKLGSMIVPGLGWASLLWSLGGIGILIAKGKSVTSAIMLELIGFDPFDDASQVLDENGQPVKPDEEDLKKYEEENNKDLQKVKEAESKDSQRQQNEKLDPSKKPKSTYPKNAEEMLKYRIRPARDHELEASGMSKDEIRQFRKEEQFELKVKKANSGNGTLTESERTRQIYLSKLKYDNDYRIGDNRLLIELGKKADEMATAKFGDKYTAFKHQDENNMSTGDMSQYSSTTTKNNKKNIQVSQDTQNIKDKNQPTIPEQIQQATVDKSSDGSYLAARAGLFARENAESQSTGSCAKYVRESLAEAGYAEPPGRPGSAYQYETTGFINKYGFQKVDAGNPLTYSPKPGDISITRAFNDHKHGHIAIYDGKNWVSDFVQKNISIYRDLPVSKAKDYISIYRDTSREGSGGDITCGGDNEYSTLGYSKSSTNNGFNVNEIGSSLNRPKYKGGNISPSITVNTDNSSLIKTHDKNTETIAKIGNSTNEYLSQLVQINKQLIEIMSKTFEGQHKPEMTISKVPKPVTYLSRSLNKNIT